MLDVLVGEWSIEARFPGAPPSDLRGRVVFEWMSGERFLIQRWEVPIPEAPDGVAIIGFDAGRQTLLQHYFDSRGVARVYEMTLEGGVWTLSRTVPDFSPLSFSQRFTGSFSDDGMRIDGRWEKADEGAGWELDFDLIYRRAG
jgi:hypothetical protein